MKTHLTETEVHRRLANANRALFFNSLDCKIFSRRIFHSLLSLCDPSSNLSHNINILATSGAFSSTALSVFASSFHCVLAIFSSRLKVLFRARDFFSSLLFLLRRRLFHLVSPPPPPHAPSSLQFFLRRRLPSSIFPTKS